jgi:hypothetical protein
VAAADVEGDGRTAAVQAAREDPLRDRRPRLITSLLPGPPPFLVGDPPLDLAKLMPAGGALEPGVRRMQALGAEVPGARGLPAVPTRCTPQHGQAVQAMLFRDPGRG